MYTSLCFGLRNSLNTVNTRLIFHYSIYTVPCNTDDYLLETTRSSLRRISNINLPPFCFKKLAVHSEKVTGENTCLITSCPSPDFHNSIFIILGIGWNDKHFYFFLHLRNTRCEFIQFSFSHFTHLLVLFCSQK